MHQYKAGWLPSREGATSVAGPQRCLGLHRVSCSRAGSRAVWCRTKKTLSALPLLTVNAGPRDADKWKDRLKEVC